MARNISNIVDFIQYLVRKERGVYISPSECTTNLDAAQLDLFEELFKEYGANQIIHDGLRPFRVYQIFTSSSAGFVTYESNYLHLLGQPWTVTGSTVNRVDFVNEDELPFALTSALRPVTTSYPIAVDTATGFSIYPQSTQLGAYYYLKRPATPVYGYTQVGRVITYDSATSTQLEWTDIYINNIIARSLRYVGINMDERAISDFANEYEQQTK